MMENLDCQTGKLSSLRLVSRRFLGLEVESLGCVPSDDRVKLAVRRRRPFLLESPRGPASCAVRDLSERWLGAETPPLKSGFFKRFAESLGERRS